MAANERNTINSITTVTSVLIAQNDSVPPRISTWNGVTITINANSNYLATLAVDNGVGAIDCTSFIYGASSLGLHQLVMQKQGFFPWKLWMNVLSLAGGSVNVSASMI